MAKKKRNHLLLSQPPSKPAPSLSLPSSSPPPPPCGSKAHALAPVKELTSKSAELAMDLNLSPWSKSRQIVTDSGHLHSNEAQASLALPDTVDNAAKSTFAMDFPALPVTGHASRKREDVVRTNSSSGALIQHEPTQQSQKLAPPPGISVVASGTPSSGSSTHTNPLAKDNLSAGKLLWSELVQGSKTKMVKKGVSFVLDSGETCVTIPNDVIKRNKHRWDEFIIAQFQGNAPSPGALHAIANGIWSSKLRNISVSRLTARAYLLKIPCPQTRKRVLDQHMWHIEKQAMFVAKWEPGLQPQIPELTSAPVWLEFWNVPPHFYSEEGLEHIAGLVGEPLFLHQSTASMSNLEVARVFTIIDPTKALPEAVNVRFESGHIHRIPVSCPWLPPTCSHCNEVGHTVKRCPSAPITCNACKSTTHSLEKCPRNTSISRTIHRDNNQKIPCSDKDITRKGGERPKLVDQHLVAHKLVDQTRKIPSTSPQGKIVIDIGLDKIGNVASDHQDSSNHNSQESDNSSSHDSESQASYGPESSNYPTEDDVNLTIAENFKRVISKRSKKLLRKRMATNGKTSL